MINGNYILIVAPPEYPGKKYRDKYIYEHHYVWWQNTNIVVPANYAVHHKNHNSKDNRIQNLELIEKHTHAYIHCKKGRAKVALNCTFCKKPFIRYGNHYFSNINHGQTRFYCCRSHQVKHQHILRKQK